MMITIIIYIVARAIMALQVIMSSQVNESVFISQDQLTDVLQDIRVFKQYSNPRG